MGKPSRRLWIAALVVSVVCVAGLAYALVVDWDTEPDRRPEMLQKREEARRGNGGFYLGLALGIGAGIVIGSLIAARKREVVIVEKPSGPERTPPAEPTDRA